MGGDPDWLDDDDFSEEEDDAEAERNLARPDRGPQAPWGTGDGSTGEERQTEAQAMARSHTELAMLTLADVAANGTKDAARVAAAKEILARGYGMPTRRTEQKVDVKISDQRAAHFAALQHFAAKNPVVEITDADFEDVGPPRLAHRGKDDEDE